MPDCVPTRVRLQVLDLAPADDQEDAQDLHCRRVTATSPSTLSEGETAAEGVFQVVRECEPKEKASEGSNSVGTEIEDPGLVG